MVMNMATQMPMVTSTSLTQRSPSSFGRTSDTPAASMSSDPIVPLPSHPSIAFGSWRLHSKPVPAVEHAEVAMPRRTTLTVVAVVVVAAGTGQVELVSSGVAVVPEGQRRPLPAFTGRTLDDQEIDLASLRGQPLVLN